MLLGLQPNAFERQLRIVRPIPPESVHPVDVQRQRVADARVDLEFDREPDGHARMTVRRVDGPLDVAAS